MMKAMRNASHATNLVARASNSARVILGATESGAVPTSVPAAKMAVGRVVTPSPKSPLRLFGATESHAPPLRTRA